MAASKDKKIYVSVMVSAEVSEAEWMDRYGNHIRANNLVPAVTVVGAIKRSVAEGMEKLGLNYLVVNQPETSKQKQSKSDHS